MVECFEDRKKVILGINKANMSINLNEYLLEKNNNVLWV